MYITFAPSKSDPRSLGCSSLPVLLACFTSLNSYARVKDLSMEDLEHLIEQKILEILGDPDSGLELRGDFKSQLKRRLERPSRRISHEEVAARFGQD